jgi:membrane associated rhomboid family serine protease
MRSFNLFGGNSNLRATYTIMIVNVALYLIYQALRIIDGINLDGVEQVPESYTFLTSYLTLSASDFTLGKLRFYTIITAMFVPDNIISLIFNMLIMYSVGKLIEGRYGPKVFLQIYFISGLITGGMVILCELLFNLIPLYNGIFELEFVTTSGAILGLITFMMLLLPRGEIYMFFVRVKTKNLIWIFVGFYLVIGIISQIMFDPSFILYYASVFGVIGGYLGVRKYVRPQAQQYY